MTVETNNMLIKFVNCSPRRDRNGEIRRDETGKVLTKKDRKHGRSYAVIVAVDRGKVGWSQVTEKDTWGKDEKGNDILVHRRDYFNKERGVEIAKGRAFECIPNGQYGANERVRVPRALIPHLEEMMERAEHYFK